MRRIALVLVCMVAVCTVAEAQTTIYFRRDTIYAGPGGGAIATVTPANSDTTAPTAPSSLGVTSTTATTVALSWTGSTDSGGSNLAGYKVYRQIGSGASLPVGTVNSSTTAFTDQPLPPSTSITYTIVAFDNAQNHSSASNSVNPTTSAASGDSTAPSAPTNLRGIPTTRQSTYKVRLDWDSSTDAGGSALSGYKVYKDDTLISGSNPITDLYYEDTTNTANTIFTYKVKAIDGMGNLSNYSNAVAITTLRELQFKDDFNRPDTSVTLNGCIDPGAYQCWGYGMWQTFTFRGTFDRTLLEGWADAQARVIQQADFRITAQIVANPNKTGIVFWDNYPWDSGPVKFYRAYIDGTTLKLAAYEWNNGTSVYDETVLTTASVAASTGKLAVDGTMSSRRIRVSYNDTLKIDYTDSDTSRPNRGRVGLTTFITSGDTSNVYVDDVLLEK